MPKLKKQGSEKLKGATVVNVKVGYIRPEYHNLEEWCADPDHMYIGRPGIVFIDGKRYPSRGSVFANPYKVGVGECTRENAVNMYRDYICGKLATGEISLEELNKLRGKSLGCWCKPERCHGDVLLELLNGTCNVNGYLIGSDGYVVVNIIR